MSLNHSIPTGNCIPKKILIMKSEYKDPGECVDARVYEFLSLAMDNTYNIIMGKTTLQELLDKGKDYMPFLCDPDKPSYKDIDNMLRYYEDEEDYEKCSKILKYLETKC